MFRVGEKIVCIHPEMWRFNESTIYKDVTNKLELNKVYVVTFANYHALGVESITDRFSVNRFISLKENRALKIKQIENF